MKYIKRSVDVVLDKMLKVFGAVMIEGPKWCGKTSTGLKHAKSSFDVSDPAANFSNRELARINPVATLDGQLPHLIDEWREVPAIKDAVRHAVDKGSLRGAYILTGSATPNEKGSLHSGTGRIGKLKMSTMTLGEISGNLAVVSLAQILSQRKLMPTAKKSHLQLDDLMELTIRGGWPKMINDDTASVMQLANSYLDSVAASDVVRVDGIARDPIKMTALLKSLARNVATTVTNDTLIKDIAGAGRAMISADTMSDYLSVLRRIFVLEEIPGWNPALKSPVRLRQGAKRFLFDSSLTVAGLGASLSSLKKDMKLFGNIFESYVLHELLVYAMMSDAKVFHYSDNSDLEVDAIIEKRSGDWAAIEIKLSNFYEDEAAANLLRLKKKMIDGGEKPPVNLVIIEGVGGILRRRSDGVLIVPIDLLGA